MVKRLIYLFIFILLITACSRMKKGSELTASEKGYIKELGLLDDDEAIILFDSQMTITISGNFFTNKRIASYWQNDKSDDHITSAYYNTIDTIKLIDRVNDFSNASYLEVYRKDSTTFKVYTDSDSLGINQFYNEALEAWINANKN